MFERFTDRARGVVVYAQEEAKLLHHNYIGTEHILLGLLRESEGLAANALETLGISLETVRREVEEIIGQGQGAAPGHMPFTPRAKKVLELSLREAKALGHNYIGTEHILLGVIREGEGVAAQVLHKLSADLSRVRQSVIELLARVPEQGEQAEIAERLRHLGERVTARVETGFRVKAERVPPPLCPRCAAELAKSARPRVLEVSAEEGDDKFRVLFVFCNNCGTALGTFPAPD